MIESVSQVMRLNNLALQVTIYFATVYIHSHVSEREGGVTESAKDLATGCQAACVILCGAYLPK